MSWIGCNVYVSEGRNLQLVRQLEALSRSVSPRRVALAGSFVDGPYNRTSFTLVSRDAQALAEAATRLALRALECLDLRTHEASHPRLGTVDHISCHPMERGAPLAEAAAVARSVGGALAEQAAVPVFFYGAAHPGGARLDDIRRAAGYFRGTTKGTWSGPLGAPLTPSCPASHTPPSSPPPPPAPPPDLGPAAVPARTGLVCVGAVPWLVNYNVLLEPCDLGVARAVARAVSERGGGLRHVQAMALGHEQGVEVACNVLDDSVSPVEEVLRLTSQLAAARGVRVQRAYRISKPPAQLVEEASTMLTAAAAGEVAAAAQLK